MGDLLIDEWINGQIAGWLNGWIQEHIIEGEGKPDWLAGQMNEWIDASMDG